MMTNEVDMYSVQQSIDSMMGEMSKKIAEAPDMPLEVFKEHRIAPPHTYQHTPESVSKGTAANIMTIQQHLKQQLCQTSMDNIKVSTKFNQGQQAFCCHGVGTSKCHRSPWQFNFVSKCDEPEVEALQGPLINNICAFTKQVGYISLKTFDYCIVPLKRSCPEATKAIQHTAGCLHDHDLSTWVPFTCLSGLGCSLSMNWSMAGLQERSMFLKEVHDMRHEIRTVTGLPDIEINYCLIPE